MSKRNFILLIIVLVIITLLLVGFLFAKKGTTIPGENTGGNQPGWHYQANREPKAQYFRALYVFARFRITGDAIFNNRVGEENNREQVGGLVGAAVEDLHGLPWSPGAKRMLRYAGISTPAQRRLPAEAVRQP